jgi:putative Mg2+ transporter-C (MgtC) family protein
LTILGEVAFAMLLGGVIGFEREVAGKPAGFRTHMLVSGAAAFLVGLAFTLVDRAVAGTSPHVVAADPIRIVQAIIIGIGFLGAGTIVRDRETGSVRGLTTAASLLVATGLGVCAALQQYGLALSVAVLVVVILHLVGRLEEWLLRRHQRSGSE